jgi:hypothetical protein
VCKIQSTKIEKATKKGRSEQSQSSDEKWHKDDSFMGILRRNGNPTPDSPGTQLFWRKNTSFDEVQKVSLRDNGHVVAGKWKLLGSIGGIIGIATLYLFLLGAITISQPKQVDSRAQETEKRLREKRELGFEFKGIRQQKYGLAR